MQNNQEFTFYLDESLWFKEGQGVSELIGISLEPKVAISDLGEEVRLHGTVELSGEYLPNKEIEPYRNSDSVPAGRVIEVVDREEEGISSFTHLFPVEITVSKERVANLEEVVINIETFDYELPEPTQLSLHAQLNMNGISQERAVEPVEEDDGVITIGPVQYKDEEPSPAQELEAREVAEPVEMELENEIELKKDEEPVREELELDFEESSRKNNSQSLSEFFQPDQYEQSPQEVTLNRWENSNSSLDVEEETENESSPSVNGFKQIFQHLFPNRDETYTQMKMYIVQEDETIEMIAERYEVPVKHLEKVNHVEAEVTPGQIVYIPN
ncbi:stage VI sporulation protein D [Halobacillus seohaensis]|uniref:Stage VI sporulation protein D n=1 Tax=Halobacillus seohaensis TaxID=447421 RepID=A0ABW2EH38_9BACI